MKNKCINSGCNKTQWEYWRVKKVAKENERIGNKIACSEKCFLEWWEK